MKKTQKMLEIEGRLGEPLGDYLRRSYVTNGESINQIAEDLEIGSSTVFRLLIKYNIQTRNSSEALLPLGFKKPSKAELKERYITNGESASQIGEDLGISDATVLKLLKGYGIEIKDNSYGGQKPSKEELEMRYITNFESATAIAKDLDTSSHTVLKWLEDDGIKVRTISEARLPPGVARPSKEELEMRYITNFESTTAIAKDLGTSSQTILRWLEDDGIKVRTISEALLPPGVTKPPKGELKERYVTKRESVKSIAKDLGVSHSVVSGWLEDDGIETRNSVIERLEFLKEILEEFTSDEDNELEGSEE